MATPPTTKLKVRIGDKEVEVEGEPEHVVKVITQLLAQGASGLVLGPADKGKEGSQGTPAMVDIRTFFKEKKPASDNEAGVAATYYYKFVAPPAERRDTIDKELLEKAFIEANWELPRKLSMTLVHARNAGYLSQTERGQYRLTTVGHNLVAHSLGAERKGKPGPARKAPRTLKSKPKRRRNK
jgi:hypothetical protein